MKEGHKIKKVLKEVVRDELIGLDIEVINAKNKGLIGIKGKIIDETKFMLIIETSGGIKKILKEQVVLKIHYKGKKLAVNGKLLIGRPYERLKK